MDDVSHSHGGHTHGGIPHVHASVDHLANEFSSGARLAIRLDAALMQKLDLAVDSFARVATDRGRSIIVRLDPPMDGDKGTGIIRLDRFVRQAL
jgi:transitional endoplasmic reticulum ATPase